VSDTALEESLAALSRFFVGDGTVRETLERVSELTTHAVAPADLVGLTMLVEGRARTAVFTDPTAPEVDQAQYDTNDGPCLDAFRHQRVFTIGSTREDGPWEAFRGAALEHGVLSTLSLPMSVGDRPLGAMNLYAHREHAFTDEDRDTGMLFAAQASMVLANTQAYWDARDLSDRLSDAMKHRAVIEQAKGILIAAQHCDEDAAFDLLVKASQRENLKLRDVAARIVRGASERGER
jgi:GAF domain-containing protein